MSAYWKLGRIPLHASAFNLSSNKDYRITRDEFIAFLATVR